MRLAGQVTLMHQAPRCGAPTRQDRPCEGPAVRGKARCRMHGGKSTGPRTSEGIERCRKVRLVHGRYSAESIADRREARETAARIRALCDQMRGSL